MIKQENGRASYCTTIGDTQGDLRKPKLIKQKGSQDTKMNLALFKF